MELLLALTAGSLFAAGLFMLLRRGLAQIIIGLGLLTNGTNMLIFASGGITRSVAPVVPAGADAISLPYADPVPQALILTAIVIGFGVLAFSLVLAHHVHRTRGSDDIGEAG